MEIILVKQTDARLPEADKAAVRRFLFEYLAGCNDKDHRAWNRFVRAMEEAGSGEFFSIKIEHRRLRWFHKMHMKMMRILLKSQERFTDLDDMRYWIKMGSGFVKWFPDDKGGIYPVPKSISFDQCDEIEMREFHDGCLQFFHTSHAQTYLWPALTPQLAEESMLSLLEPFEEFKENWRSN